MYITLDLMAAFVRCRYKAFLKCTDVIGVTTEYELLQRELAIQYQEQAVARITTRFTPKDILSSPPSLENALQGRSRLIVNAPCQPERGSINFPAIERTTSRTSTAKHEYALIASSPNNKLCKDEKLTAAMLGSALSSWDGLTVASVKMTHGPQFSTTKLVLLGNNGITHLAKEALATLHDLEAMVASPAPPPMYLNDHCGVCDYRVRCRKNAVDRDDLSLLRGLQPKEIETWKKRGIFTVTQLAHTFRAKTMGRSSQQPKRHSQPLQAMAVRDNKTYIRKRPEMPPQPTRVFFDVEGIPEQEFFYLIGVVVVRDGTATSQQLWADDESQQESMWRSFVGLLAELRDYVLVHFGRYERDFIREMQRRYGGGDQDGDQLLPRLFDVHAVIRTNVFFPVYSNSLKEIAPILGFEWQGPVRSGIDSILCRHKWEKTKDEYLKKDLLRYNHEDCRAVAAVFDQLASLGQASNGNTVQYKEADDPPDSRGDRFGKSAFATPALQAITKYAYFNYQQEKVFFRTDKNVRRSVLRKRRVSRASPRPSVIIECRPPQKCDKCKSQTMRENGAAIYTKVIEDVKFFRSGVRRHVAKYMTKRYICRSCRSHTSYSPEYPMDQPEFGHGIASWAIYQHVAQRQPFEVIADGINDVFGYSFSPTMGRRAQIRLAEVYKVTEGVLLSRLRSGHMICADETKVALRGMTGYVWVFSGPEIVIYRFSGSRDSTVLTEVLGDFAGVLVSDFYGVYDSPKCPQQKCLVHLVRDINDDLLKSPFDEELKELASRFTALMTPIIGAIDRYGLVKRHLGKFITDADRFRKWVANQYFTSEIGEGYQKRIGKYGDRLFTFLCHDGVPWNNNLAENAVKVIASRRRFIDGLMSKDGIRDYLIFLSIYQTLRRKGGSFLRFLLSGKTDLFEFLGE